jgi:hypothetical protein
MVDRDFVREQEYVNLWIVGDKVTAEHSGFWL